MRWRVQGRWNRRALAAGWTTARTQFYGNVASVGLAASAELPASVMPFILRGVSLLGVSSSNAARDLREIVWQRLAGDWAPRHLDAICSREVTLAQLPGVFEDMLAGRVIGRTVVNCQTA